MNYRCRQFSPDVVLKNPLYRKDGPGTDECKKPDADGDYDAGEGGSAASTSSDNDGGY